MKRTLSSIAAASLVLGTMVPYATDVTKSSRNSIERKSEFFYQRQARNQRRKAERRRGKR